MVSPVLGVASDARPGPAVKAPPALRHKESKLGNWGLSKLVRKQKETPQFILQLDGQEAPLAAPAKEFYTEGLGLKYSPNPSQTSSIASQDSTASSRSVSTTGPSASTDQSLSAAVSRQDVSSSKDRQSEHQRTVDDDIASLGGLLTRETFRLLLDNPIGLYKFGLFMASELNTEGLVFWLSSQQHLQMLDSVQSLGQNIFENHIPTDAPMSLNMSSSQRRSLEKAYAEFRKIADPFVIARDLCFDDMYDDSYPRFIKKRLAAKTQLELETRGQADRPQGIGDAFVMSEATASSDLPITAASDGFVRLTGYERRDCVGRNCRFLAGPGTSKSAQSRIRRACTNGEPCVELLLNYSSSKLPFWNLLCIVPLYDGDGQLALFLGAQINISSLLASSRDMASLLSDDLDPAGSTAEAVLQSERQDVVGIQYASAIDTINHHIAAKLDPANNGGPRPQEMQRHGKSAAKRLIGAVGRSISGSLSPKSPVSSPKPSPSTSRPSTATTITSAAEESTSMPKLPESAPAQAVDAKKKQGEQADKVPEMSGPKTHRAQLSSESRAAWEAHRRPKSSGGRKLHSNPAVGLRSRLVDNSLHFSEQTRLLEQASNSFIILDPHSYAVIYTCPTLQKEFARVPNFLKAVKSRFQNGAEIAKQLKDAIKDAVCCDVTAETLPDDKGTGPRKLTIHLTPLKNADGASTMIVISLTALTKAE